MRAKRELFLLFVCLLMHLNIDAYVRGELILAPDQPYERDFNFHNKTTFLKRLIRDLVECIEHDNTSDTPSIHDPQRLPESEALFKSTEGSPNKTERFLFKYTGTRAYNESCLGDSYKRDIIKRLYDAACMKYTEKIRFLEAVSCNATQNLECRQIGVEKERRFAEQATPIMQCLCPDFNKTQAYLQNPAIGYFDKKRQECVLKVGRHCVIEPKTLDKRLDWEDFDYYPQEPDKKISVVDFRPMKKTYTCVTNAFCYTDDNKGLNLDKLSKNSCVCDAGYFSGADRECRYGRDPPTSKGLLLTILYTIGIFIFIAVLLV